MTAERDLLFPRLDPQHFAELQWSRGSVTAERPWGSRSDGITHAQLQWSRGSVTAERRKGGADPEVLKMWLQWSRGSVTAERQIYGSVVQTVVASMEPRFGDRGTAVDSVRPRRHVQSASMEPRFGDRGTIAAARACVGIEGHSFDGAAVR